MTMKKSIAIVSSKRCEEYEQLGHPEAPFRVAKTYEYLLRQGYPFVEAASASEKDIRKVHTAALVEQVKEGTFFDPDTPRLPNIFFYASLSAGAAIQAATLALGGKRAFSLMRPPGHHAMRNRLGGFCYFNNIAIATEAVVRKAGRVVIIDIDCHHGNGTEDIFLGKKDIFYFSLHQGGIYPGSGFTSKANVMNIPLESGTNEKKYLTALDRGLERIKTFKPNLIAVSAGFDTYKKDPIGGLALEIGTYKKIGARVRLLNVPLFAVLEGGYSEELPKLIASFLTGVI